MSSSKDYLEFSLFYTCAAPHADRPCNRRVLVEAAVCGYCMYDGHNGASYSKNAMARREVLKVLVMCYKNDGKKFAELRANKRLAEQKDPEGGQGNKA